MDIGDVKGKAQLYLIDHLSMLTEKEYPYNYNEISEVIDKLADIFYGEDCEKEETIPQEEYDELESSYDDLKGEASCFRDNVKDIAEEIEDILEHPLQHNAANELKEAVRKIKAECDDFDWYC